ncbi:RNase adapter RapZ [Desulforamulus aquiferis]|uniref:RNase adapter RapZ n=1 Tax=Desulforamulus aquiferis TaxID=1397668 RepID=A0AAW7ZDW3_9FIRM|nr:RNase adapter RapZ [Desulforamulus aquiferis]MDO7787922.1 RNase adapter RapZ [Desulforamulus aquiferis]
MAGPRLLIVTGMSGAGKTQAVQSLEDLGYFCVDNLPPALIPKFAELLSQANGKVDRVALVVDIRGGAFFNQVIEVLNDLTQQGYKYEILFLEASNETLVRRYKESRRRHPLDNHGEVLQVIQEERELLREIRGRANNIIETSSLTNSQLKGQIVAQYGGDRNDTNSLLITVISFGYKYGIPLDSDLVIDVRFLPNPHYIPELRCLTGNDEPVQKHVLSQDVTKEFMEKLLDFVNFLIPHYQNEGKATLMIAIGCTGGMHRSVTLANKLGDILTERNYRVNVRHRDIMRV